MSRLSLLLGALLIGSIITAAPATAATDARAVANAYGDMVVFVLNVAAGNDGQPQKPDGEQTYRAALADQFAQAYAKLGADDQQSLSALPLVDQQLHDAWSTLPEDQRLAVRDQWAASVQEMANAMPCDLFDGLARAQLLPSFGQYEQPNISRLRQCWH